MLKSLFWAVWLFIYMGVRFPLFMRIKSLQKQGRYEEAQAILDKQVPLWTHRLFKHIGVEIQIEGQENLPKNGETVMFVSNHQSYIDIPVFLYDLGGPHALMAKRELCKVPFLRSWMEVLDCVFVERDDIRAAAAAVKEAEEHLQAGSSLIVCPEGTRSKSDEMSEFKGGAVRIAFRAGVPIIPLAIDGSYKVLEGNGYRVRGGVIRMVILPRVETDGMTRQEQKEMPGRLHDMIEAAKNNRPGLPAGGGDECFESAESGKT